MRDSCEAEPARHIPGQARSGAPSVHLEHALPLPRRAVARVADATPALAVPRLDEDAEEIPLGVVALNWVRMYLPLVAAGLPQMPGNAGPDGLGFAKAGFRELLAQNITGQDLRIGARFTGERATAVARALAEARRTIADMPANYTRFPNSDARCSGRLPPPRPASGAS